MDKKKIQQAFNAAIAFAREPEQKGRELEAAWNFLGGYFSINLPKASELPWKEVCCPVCGTIADQKVSSVRQTYPDGPGGWAAD